MSALDSLRKVVGAVDRWQRHTPAVSVPYAVIKKFGNDNANLVVVALAWYGFTAIFPLLLVVVEVFQFIGAKALGTGILTTLHQFPVIGQQFPTDPTDNKLHGSTLGLVVGLLGLLYGAQGVTQTAQLAMATVWNIPQHERTGFLPRLGRSFAGLITVGGAFLINAFITTYLNAGKSNLAIYIPVLIGLVILNSALYFAAFTLLTAKVIGPRGLIPGAVVGGIIFTALLTLGTGLANHQLQHANSTYGAFGSVIGIVLFLLLLAKLSIYAAELNPVLSRRLYPRALPLVKDPTEADLEVLSSVVYQEQGRKDQAIGVGFGEDAGEEAASDALNRARPRTAPGEENGEGPGEDEAPGKGADDESGDQVPGSGRLADR